MSADLAMYRAKHHLGGGLYRYEPADFADGGTTPAAIADPVAAGTS